ncbi:GRB10-interacting GYF protein 2 [Rhipicephalus sanguineus]|nr:GRB10-interacting GYF protein 2 [Rhipicephalus sanguineus]
MAAQFIHGMFCAADARVHSISIADEENEPCSMPAPRARAEGEKRSTFRGEQAPMSPRSRESAALNKVSAVSGPSEGHKAMIQTVQERTGETNTEFKSGTPPDSCDEDSTLTRVQLRSAKPSKQQQASMPNTNGSRDCELWLYKDQLGCVHGPFSGACMFSWFASGCFRMSLPVKRTCDREFQLLGQLMNTLGRLPFVADRSSPNQPNCSADKLQAADTPVALSSSDCSPGNEPLDCDDKLLKDSQTTFIDSQEKPRAVVSIKAALPMTGETHPAVPPGTRVRRAERVKAELGFRDTAEPLADDNRSRGGPKKEVKQHEGAWGGYKKYQPAARNFVSATQPADTKNAVYRRTSTAAVDTPTAPTTWAKVCLKAPTKPQFGHGWGDPVGAPEPVAIENMVRFPSLGGKAFAEASQNKTRNQKQDPAWIRRAAADQDFTRWCYDRLRNLPSYVHVPTFFELLRDVDSSAEIEEYVRQHFGNGEEASRFAREFVQRRFQWKQLTGWKSPAELREATAGVDMAPKGKKKVQKLNGTALGFVVAGEAFKKA